MSNRDEPFARNLRGLRAQRDMSQEELAKAIGTTGQSVQNWENGDYMPSLRTAIKLANVLKCDLDLLVGNA